MVLCANGKLIPGAVSYRCNTLAEVERLLIIMEQNVASFLCGLYLRGYLELFSDSCRTKMVASISIVFPIDHPTWRDAVQLGHHIQRGEQC